MWMRFLHRVHARAGASHGQVYHGEIPRTIRVRGPFGSPILVDRQRVVVLRRGIPCNAGNQRGPIAMNRPHELIHPRDELMRTMERIYRYRMTTTSGGNLS